MSAIARWRGLARCREGCALWRDGRKSTTGLWRDKSGTPDAPQPIDMVCVSPCRTVGTSAALNEFPKEFNVVCGTASSFRNEKAMR